MTREEEIKQASEEVLGTVEYQCGYADGARWADKTMIDKACEWLKDMAYRYAHWEYNGDNYEREILFNTKKFIEDFKKSMKGGNGC